jgi:hypothetical protein
MDRRLESLRALKRFLDEQFRVPGTSLRFGWDPIIGLIPWAGDALTAILGIGLILQAHHLRVPRVVQLRMVFNVAIDLLIGVVPVVGDAADFFWKSNSKNFTLLERHASAIQPATAGDWLFVGGVVSVIIAVALVPVFVMYWLMNAIGAHLPPLSR